MSELLEKCLEISYSMLITDGYKKSFVGGGEGKESEGGGGPLPGLSLAQLWRIVLGPTS